MTIERNIVAALVAFLNAVLFTAPSAAEKQLKYARVVPLVTTSKTILDEPISYLRDTAKIISPIITLQPGENTGVHKHGVPTYGYILSGAVTVDYGTHGKRTYRAGTAIIEAMEVWHDGTNDGPAPCRILVAFNGNGQRRQCHQKTAARFPTFPYGSNTVEPVVSRAARARCALAASLSAKVWLTSILTAPERIALKRSLARRSRSLRVAV